MTEHSTAARTTRVAVAQFAPGPDKTANIERVAAFAEEAATEGARLLVLPEYSSWFCPTVDEGYVAAAETLDGEFVRAVAAAAVRQRLVVVAGMIETNADPGDPRVSNTLVAIEPDGTVGAVYRKVHLYDAYGVQESDWMRPGDRVEPQTVPLDAFTLGLQTCYDLRFPEVSRWLIDAGADTLVVPAEWVAGPLKEDHWTTMCRARAIENTSYVVAADHVGPIGVGASMVVDPLGQVVAHAGHAEGLVTADLDPDLIQNVRETNPALRLRRFRIAPA